MKKYLLLMVLLCFVFISIKAEITDVEIAKSGNVIQSNLSFDNSTVIPGSGNIAPDYDNPSYIEGNRWSDDILVMSEGIPTLGILSTDVDETNGDIYVSLLDPNNGQNDTVYTYRSQDGGRTWSSFWTYQGSSIAGGIIDQRILIGHDAGGTWVYNFLMFDGSGSNSSNGLYVHRMRSTGSSDTWHHIISGGDSLVRFSVDRNIENPEGVFLVYEVNNAHIRRIMSDDSCQTWNNAGYVSSNGKSPSIAAGGNGYVYITYQDTSNYQITVLRYTNNWSSPSIHSAVIDTSSNGIYTPTVAAARTSPGDSQNVWLLYSRTNSISNKSIRVTYSDDGGSSWTTPAIWHPVNQTHETWNMVYPYARYSYNGSLVRVVATIREPTASYDSLIYSYATNSSPSNWAGRTILNEHRITGEFGGVVSYSQSCEGGFVVYREYGSSNIWFDAYNWNGIKNNDKRTNHTTMNLTPNPARGKTTLSYFLSNDENVKISLFNMAGSLVEDIYNGHQNSGNHSITIEKNLLPGIYFIKLNTGEGSFTKSLTILK